MTPLQPLEIYVLDCFRGRGPRLSVWDILGKSTSTRHQALMDALHTLEAEHRMVVKSGHKYELTDLGRKYLSL
ncbi:MAG TPA: hypothetical protein VI391_01020 [Thermoanaerobaculia bacterium]